MARKDKSRGDDHAHAGGHRFVRYVVVGLLLGVIALAWLSLLSFCDTDPPSSLRMPPKSPVDNWCGTVGAQMAYWLRYWLGGGAYMGVLFATVAAVMLAFGGKVRDLPWRLAGLILLVVGTSTAAYLVNPQASLLDPASGASGVVGMGTGKFLLERLNVGAWLVVLVSLGIGLVLSAENLVIHHLPRLGRKAWEKRNDLPDVIGMLRPATAGAAAGPGGGAVVKSAQRSPADTRDAAGRPAGKESTAEKPSKPAAPERETAAAKAAPAPRVSAMTPPAAPSKAADAPAAREGAAPGSPAKPRAEAPPAGKYEKDRPREPAKEARPAAAPQPQPAPAAAQKFSLPSADLLAPPKGGDALNQEAAAEHKRAILQQTLNDFSVAAEVVGHQSGPVITLFELSLAPGVKVAQVQNLATDIARALAVPGVRIFSPIPGKDTVGVEVPNLEKEVVRIRELMGLVPDADRKMALPLYLGKDAGGSAIVADLSRMPHMLIAGTTGSGKSVCINTIIMSMLLTRTPEDVRFILVDPKMVEMAAFENIPHLLCPVVNDMKRAEDILEWAATKMDERYELLKEGMVKNVAQYNALAKEEIYKRFNAQDEQEKLRIPTRMPYYVIIIDELADLIMTSSKEVESHIIRIAQKARAVGIHLILATQRPSVNVVTGLIKSNMPCRISFRVASRQESRIVLDQNGADVLLGQGDMLFLQPGASALVRAQGAFVDDTEIRTVVEALRSSGEPQYNPELMKLGAPDLSEDGGERDDLFDQAVEIILASQRGSVSLLQRRLQIGYSRSSRIIDQMAEAGILGDYKGSQARECLMTLEDWQALKGSIAMDQSGESSADGEPTSS
jgi:S-DNA-T family DNA segregation ATPase FtsK/SpoIIIE